MYLLYVIYLIAIIVVIYLLLIFYCNFSFIPSIHSKLKKRSKELPLKINIEGRTAVFYGMVQNGMPNFQISKKNMINLSSKFFSDCRFVILENDSKDGTREFLEKWKNEDDRVTIINGDGKSAKRDVDMFKKSVQISNREKGPIRIARYVNLRNQLHNSVKHIILSSDFKPSHCICLDMDQNVTLDEKGFYDSLEKMADDKSVIACTAYGKTVKPWTVPFTLYLYDSYAFLDNWLVKNGTDLRNDMKCRHIFREKINVSDGKFHQCISNFGGFSVYRTTKEFINNYYAVENIDKKGRCDCEHIGFNKRLQAGCSNAKLLIAFETFFDNQ
jgi:hypothetical protein